MNFIQLLLYGGALESRLEHFNHESSRSIHMEAMGNQPNEQFYSTGENTNYSNRQTKTWMAQQEK